MDGGRPFIGFDACHLTGKHGKHGGCLMAATSLDGQNGIVPLAIKVVRNECGGKLALIHERAESTY